MGTTSIEWTRGDDGAFGKTWNPIRGCSRVSEGCRNCYAEKVAKRFSGLGLPYAGLVDKHGRWNGRVTLVEEHLQDPLRWKKPRRIFVNSMSDLFHESVPVEVIGKIFSIMAAARQHTFQILTKRPRRMREILSLASPIREKWGRDVWCEVHPVNLHPNVWLGVSVEDQKTADERIPLLLQTPAAKRFISYEPALGPVEFRCHVCNGTGYYGNHGPGIRGNSEYMPCDVCQRRKLDWVIVGGESGPGARPFDIQWARQVIRECNEAGVSCFVKQLGAVPFETKEIRYSGDSKREHFGSYLRFMDRKGGDWDEWPEDLRVREFPG